MMNEIAMIANTMEGRTMIELNHDGVSVSQGALLQRINRRLKSLGTDEVLRKSRGRRWWSDLGDFYIQNVNRNSIVRGHVDIEALGRELGVLAELEHLIPNTDNKRSPAATGLETNS
jgi:hypothetical protein